jgi:protein-S-isoprenylcysteine O-methyltransferase Ste14
MQKTARVPKTGWVNMQEWWVNINKNGGSTWTGIYTYIRNPPVV